MKIIQEETYLKLKKLIDEYEDDKLNIDVSDYPYLRTVTIGIDRKYNPKYGDDKLCKCGHQYYRHFDSYDNMSDVGCKYCECYDFDQL